MTQAEFIKINDMLIKMKMPDTYKKAGLPYRYYLLDGVLKNPLINLFLLSNYPPHLTPYEPVEFLDRHYNTKPITLEDMYRKLKKTTGKYGLDLDNRRVLPLEMIIDQVNFGADNGFLNGYPRKNGSDDWHYNPLDETDTNIDFKYPDVIVKFI